MDQVTSVGEQSQAVTSDTPSTTENAPKNPEGDHNHSAQSEKIESRSVANDDDDVQIIFSVPRRRKRKRKRLDYSPSSTQRPGSEPAASSTPTSEGLFGGGRTFGGNPFRIEDNAASGSRFTPSSSVVHSSPNITYLGFGPSYGSAQTPHSAGFASSIPWWDSARSQSNPILDHDWKSWPLEDVTGRKRRHDYEGEMPAQQRTQFRQSTQISPRTIPMTTNSPLECNPTSTGFGSADLFGRSSNSLLAANSWPSFDWDAFNDANTNQFISQSLQYATVPLDVSQVSKVYNGNLPQLQPRADFRQQQIGAFNTWQPGRQAEISMEKSLPVVGNALRAEPLSVCERENDMTPNRSLPRPRDQNVLEGSCQSSSIPHTAPRNRLDITISQPENHGIAAIRTSLPKADPRMTRTPDILRKPSLYKIPPWPSSSAAVSHQPPAISSQATTDGIPDSNNASRETMSEAARSDTVLPASSAIESQRPKSQIPAANLNSGAEAQQNVPSKSNSLLDSSNGQFQIPKARVGRKNSPNLIVDIAETCQELFPFAAVAERHKVPIKKVFDTFSAIIQLPLLRNADDRRRHGSLGKKRLKEYRDAKKAMEIAQEAERKAQMKAMRARVEEAAKKGKAQLQVQARPLLKTAILNNARENQSGANGS